MRKLLGKPLWEISRTIRNWKVLLLGLGFTKPMREGGIKEPERGVVNTETVDDLLARYSSATTWIDQGDCPKGLFKMFLLGFSPPTTPSSQWITIKFPSPPLRDHKITKIPNYQLLLVLQKRSTNVLMIMITEDPVTEKSWILAKLLRFRIQVRKDGGAEK